MYYWIIFFLTFSLSAQTLDQDLRAKINLFKLKALERIEDNNPDLTELGRRLFIDPILSHKKNISCLICHHPRFFTSDGLPLSIGTGGSGVGIFRQQLSAKLTKRNSTDLINKGHVEFKHLFWDGRVSLQGDGSLLTPEASLNGKNPQRPDIAKLISDPLSAQAIFPIADEAEMFGENKENLNNFEKWEVISKRVISDSIYAQAFSTIFNVNSSNFNIGYIGKALGHFQRVTFQSTDTHWDNYLRGDNNALSADQKKGALIFFNKGKCILCHSGPHLGGRSFQATAVPQLMSDSIIDDDFGRYEVTKLESQRFKFRVAPLRHVGQTSPYFHSGVFETLEEVVDHYNDPQSSLMYFELKNLLSTFSANYTENFREMTHAQKEVRLASLPSFFKGTGPLLLSSEEKTHLVDFLRHGLSQ